MTIRYANPSGSNTSPYDTLAKGATDPQTIIDLAQAGDENRYYGTFTLSVTLDFDTYSGDTTTGVIKHIGINASDIADGTLAVFDGDSTANDCVSLSLNYHWFENIECKYAVDDGISNAGDYNTFINCVTHNNGDMGMLHYSAASYQKIILCKSHNNGDDGINVYAACGIYFSSSYGNSGEGIKGSPAFSRGLLFGCLVHDNTTFGIGDIDLGSYIINCVVDGETVGIDIDDHEVMLIGNRITNCINGIDFNSKMTLSCWNHFYNNTTADVVDATIAYNFPYREALTNDVMSGGIDGTNTVDTGSDDGYENRANDDFNLKSGAENRRIEVDLEVGS